MSYEEKTVGLLKIAINSVENIPVGSGASLVCEVGVGEDVGLTSVARNCGASAKFGISFPFEYHGERTLQIEVKDHDDNGKVVASEEHYIGQIQDEREWKGVIELSPAGRMYAEIYFIEAPETVPKFVTVTVVKATSLECGDHSDPYVKLMLGDGEGAHTKETKTGSGNNPVWEDSFEFAYANEQAITFLVYDKDTMGKDDLLGECIFDLWGARRGGQMNIVGELPLSLKKDGVNHTTGRLFLSVLFWNPDEPKPILEASTPPVAETFEAPIEQTKTLSSLSSDHNPPETIKTRSLSTTTMPDADQLREAADRARRARDNALRAREAADAARASSNATPLSKDAREDADIANELANDAEKEARKAQDACDQLAREPALAPSLLDEIEDAERRTQRDADRAEDAAREAARHAAEEEARRAKLASRDANGSVREIEDLVEKHPMIPQLPGILKEADELAELAAMEAKRARKAADEADRPGNSIMEAKECEERAREARRKAERLAAECAELLRKARNLIRDRDRIEAKKERLRAKKEQERLRRAELDQDELRAAEHERELERRRLGRGTGVDAAENTMYEGVVGYSYHNREAVKPHGGGMLCCGGPTVEGVENELIPAVGKQEIRGLYPNDDYDGAALLYRSRGEDVIPDPVIEGALVMTRKQFCWCFGCGCLRCCGEC